MKQVSDYKPDRSRGLLPHTPKPNKLIPSSNVREMGQDESSSTKPKAASSPTKGSPFKSKALQKYGVEKRPSITSLDEAKKAIRQADKNNRKLSKEEIFAILNMVNKSDLKKDAQYKEAIVISVLEHLERNRYWENY